MLLRNKADVDLATNNVEYYVLIIHHIMMFILQGDDAETALMNSQRKDHAEITHLLERNGASVKFNMDTVRQCSFAV